MQFAVKGNVDPRNVTVERGIVKLELVSFDWSSRTNASRHGLGGPSPIRPGDDPVGVNSDVVQGTALLEMTGPRSLRLETFPGKAAADVTTFDAGAKLYER